MATFIRLPQVITRTGLSRSGIYAAISEGTFPAQIPLGMRAVAWESEAVDRWISDRIDDAESNDRASVSVSAAAKVLGMEPDTLMAFIKNEELPSFRQGRHQLVRKMALEVFRKQRASQMRGDGDE